MSKTMPAPGTRAHLVLDGTEKRCDVYRESAALRISTPDQADRLHPMNRIDQVTARGDVWWQSEALAALGQAGIAVGILDGEGRIKALLMPCNTRRTSLASTLDRFADQQDWPDRLEDWRRAEISRHARALRLPDPALAARMGWSAAQTMILRAAGPLSRARRQRLENEMRSFALLLAQRFLREGGCPARWLGSDPDPDRNLAPLFAQIILWRLARRATTSQGRKALQKALRKDGLKPRPVTGPALARAVEATVPALRRSLVRDVMRLYRHLLELTHQHQPGFSKQERRQ